MCNHAGSPGESQTISPQFPTSSADARRAHMNSKLRQSKKKLYTPRNRLQPLALGNTSLQGQSDCC